jgi:hypothetical protein
MASPRANFSDIEARAIGVTQRMPTVEWYGAWRGLSWTSMRPLACSCSSQAERIQVWTSGRVCGGQSSRMRGGSTLSSALRPSGSARTHADKASEVPGEMAVI